MSASVEEVVGFWRSAGPDKWFEKNEDFDREFRERFLDAHMAAARRELDDWGATPEGALALMVLLDQFPRNSFRGTGHMYATDRLALRHALKAIAAGHDQKFDGPIRVFFYLPLMHSERLEDQDASVRHCVPMGEDVAKHAHGHRDVVARFGRFPHRNAILGRDTTREEQAFLDDGGFAG